MILRMVKTMRKTPTHIDGHATKKLHAFAPEFQSLLEEIVVETGHWLRIGAVNDHDLFSYMERLDDASASHPMSMGIKIDGREDTNNNFVLINTWGHLEDFPNPHRLTQSNLYRPVYQTFQLSQDDFIYEVSRLPIRIDGQHTALRLIGRHGVVDIQEAEFQSAMFAGLVLSQSFNVAAGYEVQAPQPIIIPHSHGAFVGNIVPVNQDEYRRSRAEIHRDPDLEMEDDENDAANDDYFIKHWEGGYVSSLEQPMLPKGLINIRTFYDDSMFYPEMRRSVERLRDIFNEPHFRPGIDFAVKTHLTSEYAHSDNMEHFARAIKVCEEIQNVMQLRDWETMTARSIRNGHLKDIGPATP